MLDRAADLAETFFDARSESNSLEYLWPIIQRKFTAHEILGVFHFGPQLKPLHHFLGRKRNHNANDDNADFAEQFPPVVDRSWFVDFHKENTLIIRAQQPAPGDRD